jgi:hypothetical protein
MIGFSDAITGSLLCVIEPCRYADPNRDDVDDVLRFLTVHLKTLGKPNYQCALGYLHYIPREYYLLSLEISSLVALLGSSSTLHDQIAFHKMIVYWIELIKTFFLPSRVMLI